MIVKVSGQEWDPGIPPGCSSPNGHYVGCNVVLTALEAGWQDAEAIDAATQYDARYSDAEWQYADVWQDIVTDAESYLNDATEDGMWLWSDGDFRLVATDTCEDCGELFDADDPGTCPEHGIAVSVRCWAYLP